MRIAGILLLFAAAGLAGFLKAAGLHRRTLELDGLIQLVGRIHSEIRYFRTPALELVQRLTGLHEFEKYRVIAAFHERLAHAPDLAAAWAETPASQLTDDDRLVVDEFVAAFGKTDLAGQCDVCAGTADRLRRQREEAAAACGAKARLYRSLGLLGGALIAVVLI